MNRLFVIVRHTFIESIVQPIFSLLMGLGTAILIIYALLPFFTLSEDTVMFKAVGLDIVLLLVLISTLFATSKSIFEEIEDRTMLTLMSKPVRRWEVLVGKYLGIILAALLGVVVLGGVLSICLYLRIPTDYNLRADSIDERIINMIWGWRKMHLLGLIPQLFLLWMQICVLASVGVALSTRVPLVVNLPLVIILYLAGNLTRFLFPLSDDQSIVSRAGAHLIATILPYLQTFDLTPVTVYKKIKVAQFVADLHAVSPGDILRYLLFAMIYAISYIFFALLAGLWLFQHRELGGAEG